MANDRADFLPNWFAPFDPTTLPTSRVQNPRTTESAALVAKSANGVQTVTSGGGPTLGNFNDFIASPEGPSIIMVFGFMAGSPGVAPLEFVDLVACSENPLGHAPFVISSNNASGAPGARTYSTPAPNRLKLVVSDTNQYVVTTVLFP